MGSKVTLFSFLKVVMLHNQINKNEAYNTMHANVLPFTPLTPVWGHFKGKNIFFSEEGYCAHYAIKMFDIMHTLAFWVG